MNIAMKPDTEIPCEHCHGKGLRKFGGNEYACGACFGFGLSTCRYDQRFNATTITVWDGDNTLDGYSLIDEHNLPSRLELAELPSNTLIMHSHNYIEGRGPMGRIKKGYIMLVSWPNPLYNERLALLGR